jgi:hypothetical protein
MWEDYKITIFQRLSVNIKCKVSGFDPCYFSIAQFIFSMHRCVGSVTHLLLLDVFFTAANPCYVLRMEFLDRVTKMAKENNDFSEVATWLYWKQKMINICLSRNRYSYWQRYLKIHSKDRWILFGLLDSSDKSYYNKSSAHMYSPSQYRWTLNWGSALCILKQICCFKYLVCEDTE